MYQAKKRNFNVISQMETAAIQEEAAFWAQRRLNINAELRAKGISVPSLPREREEALAESSKVLSRKLSELIPMDKETDRNTIVIALFFI
jgi:hypothetical protein